MSRVGKKPVLIPEKVKVAEANGRILVEGPLGKNQLAMHGILKLAISGKEAVLTRSEETSDARRIQGLVRALLQNAVTGVSEGFQKTLDIEGVGYRAEAKGNTLNLTLGFSHPVEFPIPTGIKVAVEKQTKIRLSGVDKVLVGQVASNIRALRPPEPYKGKGIRYEGEYIQRKAGKAAATGGGK